MNSYYSLAFFDYNIKLSLSSDFLFLGIVNA